MAAQSLDERVRDIVAHAYDKTPAMRGRMERAGLTPQDIQTAEDLAKLPVMTKDEMAKLQAADPPFGGMLAVDRSELAWIFISPGPLYEAVADVDSAVEQTAATLRMVGFSADDVVLNAMTYNLVPFGLLFDAGARSLGATVLLTDRQYRNPDQDAARPGRDGFRRHAELPDDDHPESRVAGRGFQDDAPQESHHHRRTADTLAARLAGRLWDQDRQYLRNC
jgi:hypothetical protein